MSVLKLSNLISGTGHDSISAEGISMYHSYICLLLIQFPHKIYYGQLVMIYQFSDEWRIWAFLWYVPNRVVKLQLLKFKQANHMEKTICLIFWSVMNCCKHNLIKTGLLPTWCFRKTPVWTIIHLVVFLLPPFGLFFSVCLLCYPMIITYWLP